MPMTESEIVESMNQRIDVAFAEEIDRKIARNKARVNLHALTASSGDHVDCQQDASRRFPGS